MPWASEISTKLTNLRVTRRIKKKMEIIRETRMRIVKVRGTGQGRSESIRCNTRKDSTIPKSRGLLELMILLLKPKPIRDLRA